MNNITTTLGVQVMQMAFSWYDYMFFGLLLGVSVLIGLYFGCFGNQQSTQDEYLFASKRMKVFPVSISLIASHVSGIALLAIPADAYHHGANLAWILVAAPGVTWITAYVFLPIFYELKISSSYEYLEKRFDARTRTFASILFDISMFLYLPIVIYIPALAFSIVTGLNIHFISSIVCAVCIFYTTIGGVKAVIWSDTLQFIVTIGSTIAIFILGVKATNGFADIIDTSVKGHRLDLFDFNLDPTRRDGFWSVFFGYGTFWLFHGVANQSCVQKYLTVPTLKKGQMTVVIFFSGWIIITALSLFTGLIMYAKYENCDPFSAGTVKAPDGLLPYYVMDVAGHIPGLSGLFIAGIFSAALSTLSATLNCLAGTIYEDIICKVAKIEYNSKSGSGVLKIIVVVIGIGCTLMVVIIEKLGGLFALAQSFLGVTAGPLLSLFVMGALMPMINKKGAFYGAFVATLVQGVVAGLTQYYKAQGRLKYTPKPFNSDECPLLYTSNFENFNESQIFVDAEELPFYLFRITHYYYAAFSLIIAVVVAMIVSYFTKHDSKPVPRKLLSPIIRFLVNDCDLPTYGSIEKPFTDSVRVINEEETKI
ncbi:hypothetical protein HHI36_012853 [Cryptolaemus montrouzieri]|uniref:Uncharacterized protein n=1 Tax=Cryptolaemus montrouzieri TaxID=559131 RepID=A0ABD2NFM8_9CUCU